MAPPQEVAFLNAIQPYGPALDKPRVSVFFPVYNDERTVERVALKALEVLSRVACEYEVVIIDDGTPCRAGQIADELAAKDPRIRVPSPEESWLRRGHPNRFGECPLRVGLLH